MIEGPPITISVEERSALVLNDLDWQQEQRFRSSEPVFIHGLVDGEQRGVVAGHLVIERDVVDEVFQEKTRYVRLSSVSVHPHENWRRKGLGSSMVVELEEMGKRFGAVKIVGEIGAADLQEQPWLTSFYEKLGFNLSKKGEGYLFEKELL